MNIPNSFNQVDQWKSVMFLYDSALKEINTKIEILNNEFVHIYNYNPIEHIKSRLKTPDSIVKKLKRYGFEVTIDNMVEKLSPWRKIWMMWPESGLSVPLHQISIRLLR